MKTPISYYGGKQKLVPEILPLIPKHTQYVEPFCGGAAVFWAKEPSQHEVINDLDGRVVNFYRVLQTRFNELQSMIQGTLHSEAEWKRAKVILKDAAAADLDRAWAFWVQTNTSFGKVMMEAFGHDRTGTLAQATRRKRNDFDLIFAERLANCEIFCRDALNIIRLKDGPETFFYVDPPYVSSDSGHYAGYVESDFKKLLAALSSIQGKFLLSSYPEDALVAARLVNNWNTKDIDGSVAVNNNRAERKGKTECLTYNYSLAEQPIGLFAIEHLTA